MLHCRQVPASPRLAPSPGPRLPVTSGRIRASERSQDWAFSTCTISPAWHDSVLGADRSLRQPPAGVPNWGRDYTRALASFAPCQGLLPPHFASHQCKHQSRARVLRALCGLGMACGTLGPSLAPGKSEILCPMGLAAIVASEACRQQSYWVWKSKPTRLFYAGRGVMSVLQRGTGGLHIPALITGLLLGSGSKSV